MQFLSGIEFIRFSYKMRIPERKHFFSRNIKRFYTGLLDKYSSRSEIELQYSI